MLLFDLTPEKGASEGNRSTPRMLISGSKGNLLMPLPDSITCAMYLELDITVQFDFSRVTTDLKEMDTMQILCTLSDVNSYLEVLLSDLLPHSVARTSTLIVNADPHTEGGLHWLAIRPTSHSSRAYYFDSFGNVSLVNSI